MPTRSPGWMPLADEGALDELDGGGDIGEGGPGRALHHRFDGSDTARPRPGPRRGWSSWRVISGCVAVHRRRGLRPPGLPLLGEGQRPFRPGRGGPTCETSSSAPALQASVSPSSSAPHRARLVAAMAAGEFLAIFSASSWAAARSWSGRIDDLADHAQLVGPPGVDPLVPADQGHPHDRLDRHLADQADGLDGGDLADRDMGIEEGGVRGGDHDVGVGDPVEAATGTDAVHRGDDRLGHLLVPGGEVEVEILEALPVPLHADPVGGQLGHIHAGLERPALAGVDDHPYLRDPGRARSTPGRTRRASGRSWH